MRNDSMTEGLSLDPNTNIPGVLADSMEAAFGNFINAREKRVKQTKDEFDFFATLRNNGYSSSQAQRVMKGNLHPYEIEGPEGGSYKLKEQQLDIEKKALEVENLKEKKKLAPLAEEEQKLRLKDKEQRIAKGAQDLEYDGVLKDLDVKRKQRDQLTAAAQSGQDAEKHKLQMEKLNSEIDLLEKRAASGPADKTLTANQLDANKRSKSAVIRAIQRGKIYEDGEFKDLKDEAELEAYLLDKYKDTVNWEDPDIVKALSTRFPKKEKGESFIDRIKKKLKGTKQAGGKVKVIKINDDGTETVGEIPADKLDAAIKTGKFRQA